MSEDNLMCECGWSGHRLELVSTDSDPDNHKYCPDCQESDYLEAEDCDDE